MSQINVSFKVSGNELSQYIDSITKKSEKQTQEAIKGALEQTKIGKELLDITNKQIALLEKKTRLEAQAARSIALEQREAMLKANASKYDDLREGVYNQKGLSDSARKEKIQGIDANEKYGAESIKTGYRDNLTVLKETERQSKLQTQLSRENIETLKQTAANNVKAIMSGDKKLEDVISGASTEEEKMVARLTEQGVAKERKGDGKDGHGPSILGSMLTIDNLNKFVGTIGQFGQTQNGFDQIGNIGRSAGQIAGGVLGGIIGSLIEPGLGTLAGANIGGEIGNMLGGTVGEVKQRQAIAKEEFFKSRNRFNAITGSDPDSITDTSDIGVSAGQFIGMQGEYARRRGYSAGSHKTALDALYAEKGVGVDAGTSAGIIEFQRSAKENNRDLAGLIGGVLQKGQGSFFKNNDTSFLNEFMGRFSTMQKELLKTNTIVGTGTTFNILSKFDSVGGEFSARDPRSGGLINTINSSLANPNTDFKKALSFYALKRANPNMSLADIIEEQQKGLSSPTYLSSMMDAVNGMGGNEDSRRLNFAGLLGMEGNQKFASDIYRSYRSGKFKGPFATGELSGAFDFKSKAEANTTDLDRNTAKIANGLLQNSPEAVAAMADAMKIGIENSLSGAVIELKNGTITLASRATIQHNTTRAAGERQAKAAVSENDWRVLNNSSSTGAFYK